MMFNTYTRATCIGVVLVGYELLNNMDVGIVIMIFHKLLKQS
jgi:hypothetical protein